MRKVLFGCLFFSFFASFGQFTVTSPVDDIAVKESLRYAIANWDGSSEILLDVDEIVLDKDQGDMLILQGMRIKSKDKTTIKGSTTTYQHFRIGGYWAGNRPSVKPTSVNANAVVFEGITFTEFGNTPLYIVDYYINLELKNCGFEKNIIMPAKNDPLVLNQTISDESRAAAIGVGNDLYSKYTVNSVVINNTDFIGNEGQGVGAVYLNQASLTIENVNFDGNKAKKYSYTAEGDGGPMSYTDGFGGAITVLGGQAILKNSIFKGNEAELLGGSVYQDSNGELTIDKCDFIDSKSNEEGGAIYTKQCEVTLDNSYFTGCSSVIGGVVCARDGVFLELTNNTIVGNGVGILPDKGGVIYSATKLGGQSYGSNVQLIFNTIVNNKVSSVITGESPNPAIIEFLDEADLKLTANIVTKNGQKDLYSNKSCELNGGNFIEKTVNGTVYDESNINYIDAGYVGPGLKSLTPIKINGRNVLPLKPCGAAAMNILPRTSSDGLPNEDALGRSRLAFTHSDAGAYEVQRVQDLSISTVDTIFVTTDEFKPFSDITFKNDCNVNIVKSSFKLLNFHGQLKGLEIRDTITHHKSNNDPGGIWQIIIDKNISNTYLETLLRDKFIVNIKPEYRTSPFTLEYTIIDSGGDTIKGQKVITFPDYPILHNVKGANSVWASFGVADTVVAKGNKINLTNKIIISLPSMGQFPATSQTPPTTQSTKDSIVVSDFMNQTDTSVSFVIPALKEGYYSVKLLNSYGTYDPHGSTGGYIDIKKPEVNTLPVNQVHAGDTVYFYGNYLGGLDTISVGGQTIVKPHVGVDNSGDIDTAWFTMPSITANTATVRASNPAGIAANTPAIRMLKDTIENFSLADATLSPFCLRDEIELSYKPVGAYNAPYDSVVLYGVLGGVEMEIGAYHVASPNNDNVIKFKADYQFTRLKLEPKSNSGAATTLGITVQSPPTIVISNLKHETCAKDSNGGFTINISGAAGVSYTTTVNGDTVTNLIQQNLIPGLYKVVSGFNGCDASIDTTINQGSVNKALDFKVNAPVNACQDAYDVEFNVFDLTAPKSTASIQWQWKEAGEAGGGDSIQTYIPYVFPSPDSVTMRTTITSSGCYTPKRLIKETIIPYVSKPELTNVTSLTNEYVICDSNDLFSVPFKSNVQGPFTLYYSYGDVYGNTSDLDTYTASINDTLVNLSFKYKKPKENQYYTGQTDSISYRGCVFGNQGMSGSQYNMSLKLIPTTKLALSVIGETCFGGDNGVAKIDTNPNNHFIRWYSGMQPAAANQLSDTTKTISNLKPGQYTLVVKDKENYCPDTTNFTINKFTDKPSYDIVSEELCAGQDYQFKLENVTASNIQSVDWKIGNTTISGSSSVDTLSPVIKITNQMYEDTLFVSVNVQECGTSKSYQDTLLLNVNRDPNLSVRRNQTASVVSCDGIDFNTSYTLDSLITGTVWYSLQDAQSVMTNQNISINASDLLSITTNFEKGAQEIKFDSVQTGTCTFGIGGDLSTQLMGYDKPSVTDLQIQDEKCIGDSNGVLIAKSVGTLHWLNDKNLIISKQDTVSALPAGLYQVFATASTTGDCPSDTLDAVIKPGLMKDSVSFMMSGSDSVCSNLNLELGIASSKGKGTFTWIYNGNIIQSNTDSSYQLSQALNTSPNTYRVVMTNEAICKANVEYVMSGSVTALTVPQKAAITGDASPICSTNPLYRVLNKSQEDIITWTVTPTGLGVDYDNGDLTIYSLEKSVQIYAKLESNEGCVGEISDVFAVKPQGCALSAALAVLTDASGNAMDTVCRSNPFIAVNTSVGDYTSTKWKINDTVISTSSDTLRYDLSKLPSGTYDLEIVVENVAKKDSTTLAHAFTVVDTLPSQDILGNQYSCFGEEQAYYFNTRDLAIIQNATWSATNGTLKDSVFVGDSLITLFTPTDVNAQSSLALTLTSTCNEQKNYSKAIMNFSEDLSVIQNIESCDTIGEIVVPQQLVKSNYTFVFKRTDGVQGLKKTDSTYSFNKDGEYSVEFVDATSKCKGYSKVKIGIIPGFTLNNDTIYTRDSTSIKIKIDINSNDAQYIDLSNYVLDKVGDVSEFANAWVVDSTKTLFYEIKSEKINDVQGNRDSLYYFARNKSCTTKNAVDSAKVYVFISKPIDDTSRVVGNSIKLDSSILLKNDLYMDIIIFNNPKTESGKGSVSSEGLVSYPEGIDKGKIDYVSYLSCRLDSKGKVDTSSCLKSRTILTFPSEDNGKGSTAGDGEAVSKGKDFFDLHVYNVVTPDGDGIHDYFKITLLEKETGEVFPLTSNIRSTLQIFTKWGDLVYEAEHYVFDDPAQFFKGETKDGKILPNGTYYYVYDLKIDRDETVDQKSFDLSKDFYNESGFLILKRP